MKNYSWNQYKKEALPRQISPINLPKNLQLAISSGFFLGLLPLAGYGQGACGLSGNVTTSTNGGDHGEGYANVDGGAIDFHFYGSTAFSAFMTVGAGVSVAIAGTETGPYRVPQRLTGGETLPGAFNFQPVINGYFQLVEANFDQVDDADAFNPGESGYIAFRKGNLYGFVRITVSNPISSSSVVSSVNANMSGIASNPGNVTVGSCASLPVELTQFRAEGQKDQVELYWQTASEINNAGFDLQRSSDGRNFTSIAWIEGYGTTSETQSYYHVDTAVRPGKTYYYRLRQMDHDGQYEFSDMIVATTEEKGQNNGAGHFFPNPSRNGIVQLDLSVVQEAEWTATVFDITGRQLHTEIRLLEEGKNRLNFDFSTLDAGTYYVKLQGGERQLYRKLIIQ